MQFGGIESFFFFLSGRLLFDRPRQGSNRALSVFPLVLSHHLARNEQAAGVLSQIIIRIVRGVTLGRLREMGFGKVDMQCADVVRLTGEALTSGACKLIAASNFPGSFSISLDDLRRAIK